MILIARGVCKMNSSKRKVIGPHVNPSFYTKIPECLLPTLTLGTVVSCPARWAVALPRAPVAGCFSTGTGMLAAWPKCPLRAFCGGTAGSELPPQGAQEHFTKLALQTEGASVGNSCERVPPVLMA